MVRTMWQFSSGSGPVFDGYSVMTAKEEPDGPVMITVDGRGLYHASAGGDLSVEPAY